MEKKIEISEPECISAFKWYKCETKVDGVYITVSYGNTPEQAQQNARIAASGYLVEELVEVLSEVKKWSSEFGISQILYNRIDAAITKATNTK